MKKGTRLYLLAPIVRGRKGEYRKEFLELLKSGFQRVKVDGEFYEIEDVPELNKKVKHDIEVVVDRLVVRPDLETRLADSIETALELSDGLAVAETADDTAERSLFSAKFACPVSGFTIEEIEPRLFSFNNPFGACPTCDGLGQKLYFDPELIVPDQKLQIGQGAFAPWGKSNSPYYIQTLESIGRHYGFIITTPYEKLPEKIQEILLHGSGDEEIEITYNSDNIKSYKVKKTFEGVIGNIKRRWRETDSGTVREELAKYQSATTCDACQGHRLKPEALVVKIDGKHISEITELSVKRSYEWFQSLSAKLSDKENEIASRVLKEISERLGFLNNVGLEYLSLSRTSGTLSGGESQRIRLASQIGSGFNRRALRA